MRATSLVRSIILSVWMTVPAWGAAEGDEVASQVAKKLGYDVAAKEAQAVSKVWPADETKTIVALAIPSKPDESGTTTYDLHVLVVETSSGAVRSRFTEKEAISSDGIPFVGLTIDTAPYRLAKGVRAFGVRMEYDYESGANPYGATTMDLFVESGGRLRRVLHRLQMSSSGGEHDGPCKGRFSDDVRTIRLGKSASNGFQDLVVDGKVLEREMRESQDGDCQHVEKPGKPERFTLRYDGRAYPVPPELR